MPDPAPPPKPARNVEGIMDNSFLIEEAYNQQPGISSIQVTAK